MKRYQRATLLQKFLEVIIGLDRNLVSRQGDRLVIQMDTVNPFGLFTSVFNSLGDDPVFMISRVQEIIDGVIALFGVKEIIFCLDSNDVEYVGVEIGGKSDEAWLTLVPGKATSCLPKLKGVVWQLKRKA